MDINKPMNAADILDMLDEFFAGGLVSEREQTRLWDVLSALRGPDCDDRELKTETTSLIRGAAFPKAAKMLIYRVYCRKASDAELDRLCATSAALRQRSYEQHKSSHFTRHIEYAAQQLHQMRYEKKKAAQEQG